MVDLGFHRERNFKGISVLEKKAKVILLRKKSVARFEPEAA
jgi:hypothetical protein